MSCYHPLYAFKNGKTENGKDRLTFCASDTRNFFKDEKALRERYGDKLVPLPCGHCIGCVLDRAKEWSIRCVLESLLHEHNSFITLTFDEQHYRNKLDKSDLQKFFKRLRKLHPDLDIRYFACGERGTQSGRCHYHAILFGYDFPDKEYLMNDGISHIFRSSELEKLWPYGMSSIGDVSLESCAYVARYSLKKAKNSKGDEFLLMSRRPAIGKRWFLENKELVYITDHVYGSFGKQHSVKPPRYFDKLAEAEGIDLTEVKNKRIERARQVQELAMYFHSFGRYEQLHCFDELALASKLAQLKRYV